MALIKPGDKNIWTAGAIVTGSTSQRLLLGGEECPLSRLWGQVLVARRWDTLAPASRGHGDDTAQPPPTPRWKPESPWSLIATKSLLLINELINHSHLLHSCCRWKAARDDPGLAKVMVPVPSRRGPIPGRVLSLSLGVAFQGTCSVTAGQFPTNAATGTASQCAAGTHVMPFCLTLSVVAAIICHISQPYFIK